MTTPPDLISRVGVTLLWTWLAISLGNVIYLVLFHDPPGWGEAAERSYFQGSALLVAWLVLRWRLA
jgi:hypothetical protein